MRKGGVITAAVVVVVVGWGGIMVMASRGCLLGSSEAAGREVVGLVVVVVGKGKGKGSSSLGLEGAGIILVVGSGGEGAAREEGIGDCFAPGHPIGPLWGMKQENILNSYLCCVFVFVSKAISISPFRT